VLGLAVQYEFQRFFEKVAVGAELTVPDFEAVV
jgi:hypothetical protein